MNSCVTESRYSFHSFTTLTTLMLCALETLKSPVHSHFALDSSHEKQLPRSYSAGSRYSATGQRLLISCGYTEHFAFATLITLYFVLAKLFPSSLRVQYSSRCYSSCSRNSFRVVYARSTHRAATVCTLETHWVFVSPIACAHNSWFLTQIALLHSPHASLFS